MNIELSKSLKFYRCLIFLSSNLFNFSSLPFDLQDYAYFYFVLLTLMKCFHIIKVKAIKLLIINKELLSKSKKLMAWK